MANITDGTSNSLALGERNYLWSRWEIGAYWAAGTPRTICNEASNNFVYPINAAHEEYGYYFADNLRPAGTKADLPLNSLWFGSEHPGGAHFAMADASGHFISDGTDLILLPKLSTIAGGETDAIVP
jgi:hypothetical protein